MSGSGSGDDVNMVGVTTRYKGEQTYPSRGFYGVVAKREFYKFFNGLTDNNIEKTLIGICNPGGKENIGKNYITNLFKGEPIRVIAVVYDNAFKILAFAVLKDKGDNVIDLSLICSGIKGAGTQLLNRLDTILLQHTSDFNTISLDAINGKVASIYAKSGFEPIKIIEDNMILMKKPIEDAGVEFDYNGLTKYTRSGKKYGGRKRKTHKNGLRKRKTMRRRR